MGKWGNEVIGREVNGIMILSSKREEDTSTLPILKVILETT
jgi:hypothetical protein